MDGDAICCHKRSKAEWGTGRALGRRIRLGVCCFGVPLVHVMDLTNRQVGVHVRAKDKRFERHGQRGDH